MTQLQLTTLLLITGAAWLLLLLVNGVAVRLDWLKHLSAVVSVAMVSVGAFERWLWRLPVIRPMLAKRPVILGTWRARMTPASSPDGAAVRGSEGYMVVRQTFSGLSMRLLTQESSSETLVGSITRSADGLFEVVGVYRNTPDVTVRGRSPIHLGALLLRVHGDPPESLAGQYWTDRATVGTIELTTRQRRLAHSFSEAEFLFDGSAVDTALISRK
jgi:hypothetical protein